MERDFAEVPLRYERPPQQAAKRTYVLRLYVTGSTPASVRCITNLKLLCEGRLNGRFELEVIDVLQRPALAKGEQIMDTSTLVRLLPVPMQRVIGGLAGAGGKLFGLDVRPRRRWS